MTQDTETRDPTWKEEKEFSGSWWKESPEYSKISARRSRLSVHTGPGQKAPGRHAQENRTAYLMKLNTEQFRNMAKSSADLVISS